MYNVNEDALDEEYTAYLDENCKCLALSDECTCLTFESWFSEKVEDYYACFEDII